MKTLAEKYGANEISPTILVQSHSVRRWEKSQYENAVAEIIGIDPAPVFDTEAIAHKYFLYALMELHYVTHHDEVMVPEEAWTRIEGKMTVYRDKYPWAVRDEELADSAIKPAEEKKKRKVPDKERAREWWIENHKDFGDLRPKQIQIRMSEELDIHFNSCRSIYGLLKREYPLPK